MSINDNTTSLPEYITFVQLREVYGIPRTTAYRYMETCGFPKPIQMGPNSVRLRKSEILEWIDNRMPASIHGSKGVAA